MVIRPLYLAALPICLRGLIGALGRYLVQMIQPSVKHGRAAALDSTALRAKGGVWHKKHREPGTVPHTSIDTEANWSKSGHHGGRYGWKLHLACTVADLRIPLAARLAAANVHDSEPAPELVHELPPKVRFVLGDNHYKVPDLYERCERSERWPVASGRGPYPHANSGAEVRRIFLMLRRQAIKPFNGLLKNLFEWDGQVPVRALKRTQLVVLGAVSLRQLVLLYQFEHGKPLGQGIKPLLRAA